MKKYVLTALLAAVGLGLLLVDSRFTAREWSIFVKGLLWGGTLVLLLTGLWRAKEGGEF